MHNDDQLERIIDEALQRYSDAQPLAGMEERVLDRIRVQETKGRTLSRTLWAYPVLAAAMLALLILVHPHREQVVNPVQTAPSQTEHFPANRASDLAKVQVLNRTQPAHKPEPLPKLEQFPAPSPLSSEERALLAFVRRDPAAAAKFFEDQKSRVDEPLEIKPLEIKPLEIDSED
ncbi:MAG TPA: hypothetical protein VH325_16530 [Bryobacteraceae bacterium]|jgi:hypothetical protein|nr:hypothetical protein [Bryobacteraceae bacterium]